MRLPPTNIAFSPKPPSVNVNTDPPPMPPLTDDDGPSPGPRTPRSSPRKGSRCDAARDGEPCAPSSFSVQTTTSTTTRQGDVVIWTMTSTTMTHSMQRMGLAGVRAPASASPSPVRQHAPAQFPSSPVHIPPPVQIPLPVQVPPPPAWFPSLPVQVPPPPAWFPASQVHSSPARFPSSVVQVHPSPARFPLSSVRKAQPFPLGPPLHLAEFPHPDNFEGLRNSGAKKYYVVMKGRKVGVFDQWPEVQGLINGIAAAHQSTPFFAQALELYAKYYAARDLIVVLPNGNLVPQPPVIVIEDDEDYEWPDDGTDPDTSGDSTDYGDPNLTNEDLAQLDQMLGACEIQS
ncbi:hypothetical protein Hypma_015381 [Hypsizygus marmoreus]|uniref:Ribonuclease H1 N-terminal domain-containing protein n=1 Tax=Hypsizygus marmoreus TaxID=39966 RepID=A0A369KD92_HYPMA|nr:hypothetical protein Hypma_015381 [Hypsizygus marmoreus]